MKYYLMKINLTYKLFINEFNYENKININQFFNDDMIHD